MTKMIRIIILCAVVYGLTAVPPVSAQGFQKKSVQAQEQVRERERNIWERTSDWFTTVGKSKEEKKRILEQRRLERQKRKMNKEAEKAHKQFEKRTEQQIQEHDRERQRIHQQTEAAVQQKTKEQKQLKERTHQPDMEGMMKGKGMSKGSGK